MKSILSIYDQILNDEGSTYITKAISWLHIIRPGNPGYLKNYSIGLRDDISNFTKLKKFLKRNLNFLIYLFKKNVFYSKNINKINKSDILIISHCPNKKASNSRRDFVFEELALIFKKKKIKSL